MEQVVAIAGYFLTFAVPLCFVMQLWRHARRICPTFRIQFSMLDLLVVAVCFSPTTYAILQLFERQSTEMAVFWTAALVVHQLCGVFFMYVVERLTPEAVRNTPMALMLAAGNLLGVTFFPAVTAMLLGVVVMILGLFLSLFGVV